VYSPAGRRVAIQLRAFHGGAGPHGGELRAQRVRLLRGEQVRVLIRDVAVQAAFEKKAKT
jgi:hypothetical protein